MSMCTDLCMYICVTEVCAHGLMHVEVSNRYLFNQFPLDLLEAESLYETGAYPVGDSSGSPIDPDISSLQH